MEKTINNYYPAKVWLATNALGMFIVFLAFLPSSIADMNMGAFMASMLLICYLFFFSLLLSLPALALFWVVFLCVRHLNMEVPAKKSIIAAAGVIFVVLAFYVLDKNLFNGDIWELLFPVFYSAALAVSAGVVSMYKKAPAETDFEPAES